MSRDTDEHGADLKGQPEQGKVQLAERGESAPRRDDEDDDDRDRIEFAQAEGAGQGEDENGNVGLAMTVSSRRSKAGRAGPTLSIWTRDTERTSIAELLSTSEAEKRKPIGSTLRQ